MDILIDSEIRNWVFVPIIAGMLLFSLIRMNIQKITRASTAAANEAKSDSAFKDKVEK